MGQILICVADVEPGGDGGAEVRVEIVPDFVADDEHEAREARQRTVVESVVEERRAARADGRELLEAAEAGGPAGREDDEGEGWGGRISSGVGPSRQWPELHVFDAEVVIHPPEYVVRADLKYAQARRGFHQALDPPSRVEDGPYQPALGGSSGIPGPTDGRQGRI